MSNNLKFYIDGAWVDPIEPRSIDVINPATEESAATISLGSAGRAARRRGGHRQGGGGVGQGR